MNFSCKTQYVNYHCATFSSFYLQLSIDHVNYIPKKCDKKNILLNSWGLFAVSLLRLTDLSENNIVPKFVYYFDCMLVPLFWKENRQTHSIRLTSLKKWTFPNEHEHSNPGKGGSVGYLYLHCPFSFLNSIYNIVPTT